MGINKNDNKKKYQVIQHLYGISEVNNVHNDLSRRNSFYGRLLKSQYRGGEAKIKVESEEYVQVMDDETGKKIIQKEIGALVLLM